MSRQSICITSNNFNADNLVISEVKELKIRGNIKMKIAEITYKNEKNELCDLYLSLPKIDTYGPFPQYKFGSESKKSEDIVGYTISYQNESISKLFKNIQKTLSKQFKKSNIKPVFIMNKNGIDTAYFKVKMNGKEMITRFYSDKKQTKSINGLDLIKKYGELTPMIHIKSLYFGNHGLSNFTCSIQVNIVKAIFLEKQNTFPDFVFNETDSEEETETEEEVEVEY